MLNIDCQSIPTSSMAAGRRGCTCGAGDTVRTKTGNIATMVVGAHVGPPGSAVCLPCRSCPAFYGSPGAQQKVVVLRKVAGVIPEKAEKASLTMSLKSGP